LILFAAMKLILPLRILLLGFSGSLARYKTIPVKGSGCGSAVQITHELTKSGSSKNVPCSLTKYNDISEYSKGE